MSMWGDIEQDWKSDTPGTLEDKPVGGDFSLRAFNVVRCLAQAEFRSEIDRCKDEAEYLMSTLRGEKQADYLRVHFPELDEIASLRARVEAMTGALTEIAAMEIPTEFQAKGDLASGRMWRSYQAGCFGRCQAIARQALKDTPNTFDISRQEARMAAVGLKDSDNA